VDVNGRRVLMQRLAGLGPGSHVVSLARGGSPAPGIYWLRLTQSGRSLIRKACVLR
jgi:hypothetical protein